MKFFITERFTPRSLGKCTDIVFFLISIDYFRALSDIIRNGIVLFLLLHFFFIMVA